MNWKKVISWFLVASPFLTLLIWVAYEKGVAVALLVILAMVAASVMYLIKAA